MLIDQLWLIAKVNQACEEEKMRVFVLNSDQKFQDIKLNI